MTRKLRGIGVTLAAVALVAAGCGGSEDGGGGPAEGSLEGETVKVTAVWSGAEQEKFKKVLDAFEEQTGAEVSYTSAGDDIATVLGTAVKGNEPPDVAVLPQPGLMNDLAKDGSLKPVNSQVDKAITENYAKIWKTLGTSDGKLYGVWVKAANKSLMWYDTKAFEDAGVEAPRTWDELNTTMSTISDSGLTPLSVAGADGWTLTDWFENVYLRVAGPEMYDKLSKHEIKWTDPTVKETLKVLGELWGGENIVAGGPKGALQTKFEASVANVFGDNPKAAIVFEGDFVGGVIGSESEAKVGETAKFFDFPAIDGSEKSVVGAGDVAVAMKDTKGAQGLLEYLATPEAAEVWAKEGGFVSPNKNVDMQAYADEPTRAIAKAVIESGDSFRFDMSDLQPAAFGATVGKGMWKTLQDFLGNPTSIDATASKLEADAAKAYGGN
ncbi:MAG: ABC transporter substrate-binding protein [Micromonosporaceae bacterium]